MKEIKKSLLTVTSVQVEIGYPNGNSVQPEGRPIPPWQIDLEAFSVHFEAEQEIESAIIALHRQKQVELGQMDRKARYRAKNIALLRHKEAMRRATKLNAVPAWLTSEQEVQILRLYRQAVNKELRTGEPQEVHHIVALCGTCELTGEQVVCGLHVPWNLKVLPQQQNRQLGARVPSELLGNGDVSPFASHDSDGDDCIPF